MLRGGGGGSVCQFEYNNIVKSKNISSLRKFFTARVYAKLLHSDPYGRISIMQFFNYVMRKGLDLHLDF